MTASDLYKVTPDWLEDITRKQLVIRVIQKKKAAKGFLFTFDTTIVLYSISRIEIEGDGEGENNLWFLCEVVYKVTEPFSDLPRGLEVNLYGKDTTDWYDFFNRVVIPGWKRRVPLWLEAEPVITVIEELGGVEKVAFVTRAVMRHYYFLLQRLAYEIEAQPEAATDLKVVFNRLLAFIEEREEEWGRLVGI